MVGQGRLFFKPTGCFAAALLVVFYWSISIGKTDVPVFLFSGQSNMVCLGSSANDLTADQKKTVDNIKIDSRADNNTKTWATLGPGFGADASHFGPELFFGKILSDSMPGKKIAFIKDATSGTYLGKTDGWLPPSSTNGPGTLYKNMMTHIDKAMASFTTAFDTAQYTPRWAGFVWLQGEFDGMDQGLANAYETNLTNLIKDIRTKTGVADLPIILEMIKPISTWQYAAKVRAGDVACKEKLKNVDTMDTKDLALSSDNIHYNAASQIKIGSISALRWLNMHFIYQTPTQIAYRYSEPSTLQSQKQLSVVSFVKLFDVSGRKVGAFSSMFENAQNRQPAHHCVLIAVSNRPGEKHDAEKLTVIGK
jgi:hypothetical protein